MALASSPLPLGLAEADSPMLPITDINGVAILGGVTSPF